MYKALSNIKFKGKLYVKGDDIDLDEKLGEQLINDGVVEISEKTREEVKREEAEKKEAEDEAQREADEKAKKMKRITRKNTKI